MSQKVLISYSQSPLYSIHSYWDDSFTIYNEKSSEFSTLTGSELWLDAYIDLYDPRLTKPEYLYQFFARIHQICDESKIHTIRILRNYSYTSTYSMINKVFYLYHSFVNFFVQAYNVYPIYIPDILSNTYKNHPYNQLKNSNRIEWSLNSIFRVIQDEDIITNLLDNDLKKESIMISGMKVSLADLNDKIIQVFGKNSILLENAYEVYIQEPKSDRILSDLNYNLESALIHQLT